MDIRPGDQRPSGRSTGGSGAGGRPGTRPSVSGSSWPIWGWPSGRGAGGQPRGAHRRRRQRLTAVSARRSPVRNSGA